MVEEKDTKGSGVVDEQHDLGERTVGIMEASSRLGVHPDTVRRMVKSGELPSAFYGRRYRIKVKDVEEFIEGKERAPLAGAKPQHFAPRSGSKSRRKPFDLPERVTVKTDELARKFIEAFNAAKLNRTAAVDKASQTIIELVGAGGIPSEESFGVPEVVNINVELEMLDAFLQTVERGNMRAAEAREILVRAGTKTS